MTLKKLDGVAFYGKQSFLSNFYRCSFSDDGHVYQNVETYFQYKKAKYFGDEDCANKILAARNPLQVKALSHKIKDFDEEMWLPTAKQTMMKGCAMKFGQNPELAQKLKNLKGIIVEANPKDDFFSCGLAINHPDLEEVSKWKGKNQLGEILCAIRENLP